MYFVIRPWLHQQIIKISMPTNTRLKHQSEQFWVAEQFFKRPAPLCGSATQNSSNCCLSLVFVGFNPLILCWLAGANDEVHSFKFNPYFSTFETLGILDEILRLSRKLRNLVALWGQKFMKNATCTSLKNCPRRL